MLPVTRAAIPPLQSYMSLVEEVFRARQFTNHGPMVARLEAVLQVYLGPAVVPDRRFVTACASGTLALTLALMALKLEDKRVITTPFTYVATLSAILAAGCEPVFIDISQETLCIEPAEVEKHLGAGVGAILPVHIYGNACDVVGFEALSRRKSIPVIYDAAHAFGACFQGRSLLTFGDCSAASFHATKIFHTCEGGCVVSNNDDLQQKLSLIRAFGHVGDAHIMPGLNAKMSELHAAMGLCLLPYVEEGIAARKAIVKTYDTLLSDTPVQRMAWRAGLQNNYSYYPVIFESEEILLAVQAALCAQKIIPRRYFYPALTSLAYLKDEWKASCPVAESVSRRVLCLPLYADIAPRDVERIAHAVRGVFM